MIAAVLLGFHVGKYAQKTAVYIAAVTGSARVRLCMKDLSLPMHAHLRCR